MGITERIRETVKKERIYAWMIIFILLVNALNIFSKNSSSREFAESKNKIRAEEASPAYKRISGMKQEEIKSIMRKNAAVARLLGSTASVGMLILIIGIFLDLKFIFLKLQGKNILPPRPTSKAGWHLLDIAKVIILFLFFGYLIGSSERIIFSFINYKKIDENLFIILNTSVMDILTVSFIYYFIVRKYKQKLSSLGLNLKNFLGEFILGVKSYISILPVILMTLSIIVWLSNLFNYQPPTQPIFDLFFQEKRSVLVIYLSIFVTILGPIVEEIFFRGFAYRALRDKIGAFKAIALTSLIFAALHTNLAGFFPILILGILLAYLAQKTNSLIPSITVHIMHNSSILLLLFLAKKITEVM